MGFRLSNEVLDNAPEDLTPAERLVLSVLAGYVIEEETRECYPGLAKLVKRTGLKPDSLRKVFQRLAARGLDPRVPLGVDKKGRKVFAHESQATTYRIPRFESRDADPATEEGSASRHSTPRGGTTVPKRRDRGPSEGGSASRPEVVEVVEDLSSRLPHQKQQPSAPVERENFTRDSDKVAAAWAAIQGVPNPDAEAAIALEADRLLARGWSIPDLVSLAEHLARHYPSGTRLGPHISHWRSAQTHAVAAYKAPTF